MNPSKKFARKNLSSSLVMEGIDHLKKKTLTISNEKIMDVVVIKASFA
jgi:hypothetical protein